MLSVVLSRCLCYYRHVAMHLSGNHMSAIILIVVTELGNCSRSWIVALAKEIIISRKRAYVFSFLLTCLVA